MKKEILKLFVGGYFDDRIFKGERFEGKTPFDKNINTYTLDEALQLGFVEGVIKWFEENNGKEWDNLSFNEKANAIEKYEESDEIAGIVYFETEEETEKYKDEVIKEIENIEKESICTGQIQDKYGHFRDIYEHKKIIKKRLNKSLFFIY